jgi:hypothetical protein
MEFILDEIVNAAFVGIAAQCPPVEELIEARRLKSTPAAEKNECFCAKALVGSKVILNFRKPVGDRHMIVLASFRTEDTAVGKRYDISTQASIDVDEFGE